MATFLFDEIIFGPVQSRRLGVSLGINLLPTDSKFCNFNCIYCECGWTPGKGQMKSDFHPLQLVESKLKDFLIDYSLQGKPIDAITFAGNGEPTLHPHFEAIIDATIRLRDQYYPKAKVSVLSNATMLHNAKVINGLKKVDNRILKLDSAIDETAIKINQPLGAYSLERLIQNLKTFNHQFIIQTMFLKGFYNGQVIDNTTEVELNAYLNALELIQPEKVMIYSIARDTPADQLSKIDAETLHSIAQRIEALGISVDVAG
ncbi:MAG: radical SAM protein [Bacteroidales bacterium]|nr:radical SAM protein [Bacteroidales bacterium]